MAAPMAIVGIGASIASSVVGAFGALQSGAAGEAMYKYQAGVAKMNEQIAKQNATYARHVGEMEAQREGMKSRFQIGQTRAMQSGRGLDINTGSALAVRESQGAVAEQDQAVIRANAARAAYGHEVQAMEKAAQAGMYEMAGKQAKTAGYIDAIGSVLGGVGSVSSKWIQASKMGMFGGTKGDYYG